MTIDEAIKIKEKDLADNYYEPGSKLEQAEKLSIEALNRLVFNRLGTMESSDGLLPGETKD